MIREFDTVELTADLPDAGLQPGAVGTVVYVYESGKGYEVEFLGPGGNTLAVATVLPSQLQLISHEEVLRRRTGPTAKAS